MVRKTTLKLLFATALLSLGWVDGSHAVQRSFINLGFEQPALPTGVQTCPKSIIGSAILNSSDIPGWETTHGAGDIWCTNHGGTTDFESAPFGTAAIDIWKSGEVEIDAGPRVVSAEGNQHAELSAWVKSRLYQTVCLLQGENVSWEFSHTHRDLSAETMEFNIFSSAGVEALEIARASGSASPGAGTTTCLSGTCNTPVEVLGVPPPGVVTPFRNSWTKHSGNFSWTGATGNYQFGFEGIIDGLTPDRGNLLDAIQLDGLRPFVELSRPDYASVEGAATDERLALQVSGTFTDSNRNPIDKTIQVRVIPVTAGTADYTGSAIIDVVVPQNSGGGYDSHPFPFHDQISIVADALPEGAESFELEIIEDGDFLVQSTSSCGAAGNARAVYTIDEPMLDLQKTAAISDGNGDPRTFVGDTINYVVTVTNAGTVPLANVAVTDDLVSLSGGGTAAALAVGQSVQFTGSHVITDADMVNGQVVNTASASASAETAHPSGMVSIAAPPVVHTQPLDVVTTMDFIKAVRPDPFFDDMTPANGYLDAGERVWFNFTLTNTGTLVADVTGVTDDLAGFAFQPAGPAFTLSPGQSATFSGYYSATQADVDSGEILNQATASYTAAQQTLTVTSRSPAGGATRIAIPSPPLNAVLTVTKEVSADTIVDDDPQPGDVLRYLITVTNSSNVTTILPRIVDPLLTVDVVSDNIPPVASGDNVRTFGPYDYVLSTQDIDRGYVDNTVTVNAGIPDGQTVTASARNIKYLSAHPSVELLKEATFVNLVGSELPEAGDRIDYRFTVRNTGNITINAYEITDEKAVLTRTRTPPPLAAGQVDEITYVGSRIITAEDVNAGYVENVAYLTGTASDNQPVAATSYGPGGPPTRLTLQQGASIAATLEGTWNDANGNQIADVGEVVAYAITLINTGNVALSAVDVAGLMPTGGLPEGMAGLRLAVQQQVSALAAGQTAVISYQHVLTQDDLDQGAIYAQIEVNGEGPPSMAEEARTVRTRSLDPAVQSTLDTDGDGRPDYPTGVKLPQLAKLQVVKTGRLLDAGPVQAGSRVLYEIEISNVGNVTLNDVYPVDLGMKMGGRPATGALDPFTPGAVTLAAGAKSPPFRATYTLTEADAANAILDPTLGIVNSASAEGVTRTGLRPEVAPGEAVLAIPWISITKKALGDTVRVGELVYYSLDLTAPETYGTAILTVKDSPPPGFLYLPDSATANGKPIMSSVDGGTILFHDVAVGAGEPVVIVYGVRVGSSVRAGRYQNRAHADDSVTGQRVSNEATAQVEVASEAIFDCATILGRVFEDRNVNGYHDAGEPGVAGAAITDIGGVRITTDAYGRFSIPCVSRTIARTGSNHLLKLDPRSLPTGYRIVTENPRHVRLSAGATSAVEFGISRARVIRVDISEAAFGPGELRLSAEWEGRIDMLVDLLEEQPSVLRIVYRKVSASDSLAKPRLRAFRDIIENRWKAGSNRYALEVESTIVGAQ